MTLHQMLSRQPSLEPSPVVNEAFAELISVCEHRHGDEVEPVLRDPRIAAVTQELRNACATGEFLLERSWAGAVIKAKDPAAELARFPYLSNYEQLTLLEAHALAGVGYDLDRVRRICFLGGGPLPLSALLLLRRLSAQVDVVDIDHEAAVLGTQVVSSLSQGDRLAVHHADGAEFEGVTDTEVVFVAALVGLDRPAKRRILRALATRMRRGSMLVIRSSHGLRTLLYPPLHLADLGDWTPLAVIHPMNAVINSVVVAVRR
ncbi:MAG: nicotianamine synthase family protein [Nocardioides sp.]